MTKREASRATIHLLFLVGASLFVFALPCDGTALRWEEKSGYKVAMLSVSNGKGAGLSQISSERTGIDFTNHLSLSSRLVNQILLNGSGVAAGDVDGDGRTDLYFCRLEGPNRLYRNLGDWRFEPIGSESPVACERQYSTGAVFADIDGDRDLDLLVSSVGHGVRFFLNDGSGGFTEQTQGQGSSEPLGSMSMALADVDGDADLDLYLVNYRPTTFRDRPEMKVNVKLKDGRPQISSVQGASQSDEAVENRFEIADSGQLLENGKPDRLYLNNGQGRFRKVSWTDGRFRDSHGERLNHPPYDWGLSARFLDLNGDTDPDLYVCNDFHSPDRAWINEGDGRFRAMDRAAIPYTCLYSMGIDSADINRDGYFDFFVADMLSRQHEQRMVQIGQPRSYSGSDAGQMASSRRQSMRNMLYLNRGDGTFAEIANFSGVAASGWSWCPIFMDVDLDGHEDLLITTGHERDILNEDARRKIQAIKAKRKLSARQRLVIRRNYPRLRQSNVAFRNDGELRFEEVSEQWGFDDKGICHGMAKADLDNDGDLDLAINRLNAAALIYRNNAAGPRVAIRLKGEPPNTDAVGAEITLLGGPCFQSAQVGCGGDYLSGSSFTEVFAAGNKDQGNLRIKVLWPDGCTGVIKDVQPNRYYLVESP